MTEYAYSRKLVRISSETSTSTMRSFTTTAVRRSPPRGSASFSPHRTDNPSSDPASPRWNTAPACPVALSMSHDLSTPWGDTAVIRRILNETKTWAVVGLSQNTARSAYGVARLLQRNGIRIVPVHPKAETVHGEQGYATLADIPFDVDVVDVFVRSELAGDIADQAVAKGAKAVWFQLDVIDEDAFERTTAAGLDMVMDRCPAIEWPRLGPAA